MMSRDLDLALSRRAVAAGWKFTPGQRVFAESLGQDDNTIIPDGYAGNAAEMAQLRPDFRDAATRGVLLQQVRERWGEPQAYAMCVIGMWFMRGPVKPLYLPTVGSDSETAALVAALEAPLTAA
jgi:hypothetical protein